MIVSAEDYHLRTGYNRHDICVRRMDWGIQPEVFKSYSGVERIDLSKEISFADERLSGLLESPPACRPDHRPGLESLTRILFLTQALTAEARYGGEIFHFRSAASAGALYPFELYVATADLGGLADGVYHHDVREQALSRLRVGNAQAEIAELVHPAADSVFVMAFFMTSVFFRSSWKYRDRAYRYHLLDTGHLLENLVLALRWERLPFKIRYDFSDTGINQLLRVDEEREACLAVVLVSAGVANRADRAPLRDLSPDLAASSKVSPRDVDYPEIREIHAASSKVICTTAIPGIPSKLGLEPKPTFEIPPQLEWPEVMTYPEAVMRRRSMRNFVGHELSRGHFQALLSAVCSGARGTPDSQPHGLESLAVGFLAGNVEGLNPGFYLLDPWNRTVGTAAPGKNLVREMAHVCLDQGWLSHCAMHFLFMTNLEALEETWGPRGYRYAMLVAGRLGQRIYLASTAMKIGCCGIGAFYDDEARRLLGLNAESCLLFLVAAGQVRKWAGG